MEIHTSTCTARSGSMTQILSSIYFPSPSPDSLADSLEQPPTRTHKQNGGRTDAEREGKEKETKRKESQGDSMTAGSSRGWEDKREEGGDRSRHKVQVRLAFPDSVLHFMWIFIDLDGVSHKMCFKWVKY